MERRLRVFISSTADLADERDAAERALAALNIDGTRFESWPSAPGNPIQVCIDEVEQSDALIVLLGDRYGSLADNGLSVTHLEYRCARNNSRPVFAFVLQRQHRDAAQQAFLGEVRQDVFHAREVESTEALEVEVKRALTSEFARCFRKVYSPPPEPMAFALTRADAQALPPV